MEKLLQSTSNLCIAVVSGIKEDRKRPKVECYKSNINRIIQVIQEEIEYIMGIRDIIRIQKLKPKNLWLGIVNLGIFKNIKVDKDYSEYKEELKKEKKIKNDKEIVYVLKLENNKRKYILFFFGKHLRIF